MPLSPSTSSLTSPKGLPPNPNLNPFSALSPDLEPKPLQMLPTHNDPLRRLVHYSRTDLLRLARRQRAAAAGPPPGMNPLDAWFGPTGSHSQVTDPAIASIGGPPSRSGGFGEGFGFGGGIGGGKALGRGARLGSRRPNETQAEAMGLGQMGRFATKPANDRHRNGDETRKDVQQDRRPKRDGEWRRQEPLPPSRTYNPRGHQHQAAEDVEPAWMDDAETFGTDDPAIAGTSAPDGLVHFVPGEDMIAAHRRDRNTDTWRPGSGSKPLVSFFGAGQALPDPVKAPKVFNAANYLLPSKAGPEEVEEDATPAANSAGFQSRFQRFFAGAPPGIQQQEDSREPDIERHKQFQSPPPAVASKRPPSEAPRERVDDHMAKLMGVLSAKSPPVPTPSPSHHQTPPGFGSMSPAQPPVSHHYPQHMSALPQQHAAQPHHPSADYLHSHPPDPRQPFYPSPHHADFRQYPSYPSAEHSTRAPDAQQLLANVSQRPPPHPGHMAMPPPPGMSSIDLRPHQRPPYPDIISPHDLLRDLQYPREYAPKPPQYGHPPPYPTQHFAGPPPPHAQQMPQYARPPPHLNDAQQDMLATLFAGLPGPGR